MFFKRHNELIQTNSKVLLDTVQDDLQKTQIETIASIKGYLEGGYIFLCQSYTSSRLCIYISNNIVFYAVFSNHLISHNYRG